MLKNIFNKKEECEVPSCSETLTDEPAIVNIDGHEFKVCDQCEKLMNVLMQKFEERLDDESI